MTITRAAWAGLCRLTPPLFEDGESRRAATGFAHADAGYLQGVCLKEFPSSRRTSPAFSKRFMRGNTRPQSYSLRTGFSAAELCRLTVSYIWYGMRVCKAVSLECRNPKGGRGGSERVRCRSVRTRTVPLVDACTHKAATLSRSHMRFCARPRRSSQAQAPFRYYQSGWASDHE